MSRTKKLSDPEVLTAAFNVISREGFSSFTFAQVGKTVGLSPAALVKRFKSKKQMALMARNLKWEHNFSQTAANKSNDLSGLKGIFGFLDLVASSVNSKRLGEHAIWLGTEACTPHSKRKVAAYFATTQATLLRYLRQAVLSGELHGIGNPEELAKTMEALIQGAIFQFAFLDDGNIETHLKNHFKVMLKPYLS